MSCQATTSSIKISTASSRTVLVATLIASLISTAACSHIGKTAGVADATQSAEMVQATSDNAETSGDLSDSGSDFLSIPLDMNRGVLLWIDYFQGRGRPHMERYLSRSARYMPVMKAILKKEGLPEDLIYIALIESGFSSTAHSHANAVGYWQFIRGTGKRYNLQINSYVDERRDFVKATHAAAAYFNDLYKMFGVWYLAIASYNVGEGRVKRLIEQNKTRDFWKLARENRLPEETINYVPKFLAARLIAKDPEKYGFTDIEYMPPLEWEEAEFASSIDLRKLAQAMNIEYDDVRDLNPAYKRGVAFEKQGKLTLRVPKGLVAQALAAGPMAVAGSQVQYVAAADEDYTYYRVRRGDTISGVARKFGTTQSAIRKLNQMRSGYRLVAGKRIRVPAERITRERISPKSTGMARGKKKEALRAIAREDGESLDLKSKARTHVVRRGDTLVEIAQRYGVSLRTLTNHNQIGRKSKIIEGSRIEIP